MNWGIFFDSTNSWITANQEKAQILTAIVLCWSLIWKGWALWRAARNNSTPWFIVLLILNTIGILEIIYIFGFSGYGKDKRKG